MARHHFREVLQLRKSDCYLSPGRVASTAMASRKLSPSERAFAYRVFGNSLDYDNVSISDVGPSGEVVTIFFAGGFTIHWAPGYRGILGDRRLESTFIHEMTHVWQGNNNGILAGTYQYKSVFAQVKEGVRDIIKSKDYKGAIKRWDEHRGTAYLLDASRFGRPWSSFNVEQQAMIVETWYDTEATRSRLFRTNGPGVRGGSMSPYDARFPYIRDVIRRRSPSNAYRPIVLPAGADPAIKQIQDKLVALGYLEPNYADGLVGRGHSATLDGVRNLQVRNGLMPDRDLGGPNSATRRALARPATQLNPAPVQ